MTHEQAHAHLLDLAYGELAPGELREVSRHAAECSACAAELERISSARALVADLGGGPRPSQAREELVEAARRAVAKRPTRRWFTRPAAPSFGAAAAVVAIVAGVTVQVTRDGGRGSDAELTFPSPEPSPAAPPAFAAPPPPPPSTAAPDAPRSEAPAARGAASTKRPAPRQDTAAAAPELALVPSSPPGKASGVAVAAPSPAPSPRAPAAPPAAAAREVAPERGGAGTPRKAERRVASDADESATAESGGASQVMADVQRRVASGELTEERRELRCGDAVIERVALVARGGRVVKLTERRGDEVLDAWYDDAGDLRATRTTARHAASLPRKAPALEAVATSCAW